MSQSAHQSTIKGLPDVTSSTNNTIWKEIFCLGLFINIAASGPCRLFVTDFTTNSLVSSSYHDSYFIEEFEIPTEQIFQIDLYKEKLKALIDEYQAKFGESLFDPGTRPPFRISDKLCILRASVVLKKFNNVLEGRARSVRLVNDGDLVSENLQKLYSNLSSLPKIFFTENMAKAKQVIPDMYYRQFLSSSRDMTTSVTERPANIDVSINTKSNVNSNEESAFNDSQPRQTYVKIEETTETIIPDTLFPTDYLYPREQLPDIGASQRLNPIESQNQSQNQSQGYQTQATLGTHTGQYYSLKQLNDYYSTEVNNEIYRVRGRIIGCNPSDWSQVCVKKYELNSVTNNVSLSDPFMRSFELILCDRMTINTGEEIILDSGNSLTVFMDSEQMSQALSIEAIESTYTKISELNEKSFTNRVLEFELYKKLVNISTKNQFLVWSARNISFTVIMD